MHWHPAEIITEARFLNDGRSFGGRLAGSPRAFALEHRTGLALLFALFALASRASGFAAGTLALQQSTVRRRGRRSRRSSHQARLARAHNLKLFSVQLALSTQLPCIASLLPSCAGRPPKRVPSGY